MKVRKRPIIGIVMGDAGGVGPEITAKALSNKEIYTLCHPFVIGDVRIFDLALKIAKVNLDIHKIGDLSEASFKFGTVSVLDMHNIDLNKLKLGEASATSGQALLEDIKRAVKLAIDKKVDGLVAGPHNKESVNMAGYFFTGYPDFLAALTHSKLAFNLLIADSLRVAAVTLHVPLSQVGDLITFNRVLKAIEAVQEAVKRLGVTKPRIAVAGLNPHAGEGGLFGREEITIIKPAIEAAQKEGIDAVGPLPGDSMFVGVSKGKFDAYLGMYHDQAHIAIKTLAFSKTVGLIIGIPILFATVGHGSAFQIAGKGKADSSAMSKAIKLIAHSAQYE